MMNNESVVRIDKPSITYEGPKWNSLIEGSPNGMLTYGNCLSCGRSGPVGLPCQCGGSTYAVLLLRLNYDDSAAINAEFLSRMLGCGHEAAGAAVALIGDDNGVRRTNYNHLNVLKAKCSSTLDITLQLEFEASLYPLDDVGSDD